MTLFLIKYILMISVCQSALIIFHISMISIPLNNDLSGFSINNLLALPSVFVLALFLRDLDKSSLIKFILISYFSFSFLLSFKLFTLLSFLSTSFRSVGFPILNFQGCWLIWHSIGWQWGYFKTKKKNTEIWGVSNLEMVEQFV